MSGMKKSLTSLLQWIELLGLSFTLALIINLFVMQPIKVVGKSMTPTLRENDFLILSRVGKTLNLDLDYGDIVVIDHRTDRKRSLLDDISDIGLFHRLENRNLWIKRLIGKPGDTIEIRSGSVYRNGEPLNEPYLLEEYMNSPNETFVVPKDHIFVLGDNRNNSMDSRRIGFIPYGNIKGTMVADVSKLLR